MIRAAVLFEKASPLNSVPPVPAPSNTCLFQSQIPGLIPEAILAGQWWHPITISSSCSIYSSRSPKSNSVSPPRSPCLRTVFFRPHTTERQKIFSHFSNNAYRPYFYLLCHRRIMNPFVRFSIFLPWEMFRKPTVSWLLPENPIYLNILPFTLYLPDTLTKCLIIKLILTCHFFKPQLFLAITLYRCNPWESLFSRQTLLISK